MNVIKKILLVSVLFIFGCGAFVNDQRIISGLEDRGYSDVKILDKSIFWLGYRGCSKSDAAYYEVEVKNPVGKVVKLEVCAGWPFKGVTVR